MAKKAFPQKEMVSCKELTEVKAMRLVQQSGLVKVAGVQYYDTSKTICGGKYFFMEELEGQSYFSMGSS